MNDYTAHYTRFLSSDRLSKSEKEELNEIRNNENEIKARFSSLLSFGTGGLRGVMKTGMNAMNVHTVAHATQALADLVLKSNASSRGVVIAHDSRNHSRLFAETAASVLIANGIKTYLFDSLRPTPELSFAVRELGCIAGINITASHNPKEYNGYKAYWEDGAQLSPEQADVVAKRMQELDIFDDVKQIPFDDAKKNGAVTMLGEEFDERYLSAVLAQRVNPETLTATKDFKVVYTPLHGAGTRLVPEALRRAGLSELYVVREQEIPDGNFPTTPKPNPEYAQVFEPGIALANCVGSDLIIATDPDADRVGVMARTESGDFRTITGNQMGGLLLDYIITAYKKSGGLPPSPYAVKTIVSTELATRICEKNGIKIHNVLTGFKFIGEVIKNYEASGNGTYLLGFEESYGYLKGTYARDKDAVSTALLITEMAAYHKKNDMTLIDALDELYEHYGYSFEKTEELQLVGYNGAEQINALMGALRNTPPQSFAGGRVISIGDYEKELFTDTRTGATTPTGLPKSNVLYFKTEQGDVVVVRPSGTEPKIKFYYLLAGDSADVCQKKLDAAKAVIAEYTEKL